MNRSKPNPPSRTGRWTRTILCSALICAAAPIWGDVILCKDGRRIEGVILEEKPDRIRVRVPLGKGEVTTWIPTADIESIERGALRADEFTARLEKLAPHDLAGHRALLEWAEKQGLADAVAALEKLLPTVERLHRIATHPKTWCRGCEASGKRSCPECKGKGTKSDPCERCRGEKTIRCRDCGHRKEPGVLHCSKCAGSGEVEHFDPAKGKKSMERCPTCRGKGTQVCPTCNGEKQRPCPACKGSGGTEKTCPRCSGVPEEVCGTCAGSGLQPTPVTDADLERERKEAEAKESEPASGKKEPATQPAAPPPAEGGRVPARSTRP